MKTSLTQGLSEQEAIDIKANFKEAYLLRERMIDIMRNKIHTSQKFSRSKSGYDCPNWAYKQADQNGYERALDEIIAIFVDKSD